MIGPFFLELRKFEDCHGNFTERLPLDKMPLTEVFCLKPAYLLAYTIS